MEIGDQYVDQTERILPADVEIGSPGEDAARRRGFERPDRGRPHRHHPFGGQAQAASVSSGTE